jgi:hypothetical protein
MTLCGQEKFPGDRNVIIATVYDFDAPETSGLWIVQMKNIARRSEASV